MMCPVLEPCEAEFRVFPALALPVESNGMLQVHSRRTSVQGAGAGDRETQSLLFGKGMEKEMGNRFANDFQTK
jgi:hypothetical protein